MRRVIASRSTELTRRQVERVARAIILKVGRYYPDLLAAAKHLVHNHDEGIDQCKCLLDQILQDAGTATDGQRPEAVEIWTISVRNRLLSLGSNEASSPSFQVSRLNNTLVVLQLVHKECLTRSATLSQPAEFLRVLVSLPLLKLTWWR